MNRTRIHFWVWVVVFLLSTGWVPAQQDQPAGDSSSAAASAAAVPRLVKFSGRVLDTRGEPLTGVAVRLTFAVYSEQQGGVALWAESQVAQLDEQGYYAVLLGATRADGLPVELFRAGKARWLGVQVEGRDEDPRVLLVSVPYALKAEDAAMLGDRRASDFVLGEQLREKVRTQVEAQKPGFATQAVEMLVSNPPKVPAIAEGPSTFTTGAGVFGYNLATTGLAYGVLGQTASADGTALFGRATSTTGATIGLRGHADSTGGTGIMGQATATSGTTTGIVGRVFSADGTALIVDNTQGGKLLSAKVGSVEKFSVTGSGNLAAGGNITATGTSSGTRLVSTVSTGTAPLQVTSITLVPNLYVSHAALADTATTAVTATNALNLDGHPPDHYARLDVDNSFTGSQTVVSSAPLAFSVTATGVVSTNTGISATANGPDGAGIVGTANNGSGAYGVWGLSSSGYAGYFSGDVNVTGTLSAGSKYFKIDHPLEPAKKYLVHASVESSELKTIYDGTVLLDRNGEAFDALVPTPKTTMFGHDLREFHSGAFGTPQLTAQ